MKKRQPDAAKGQAIEAMAEHILAQGCLTGIYER
jgi:phosphatidylethanolamine-binding protein (PEBP) family uncharacterized protein